MKDYRLEILEFLEKQPAMRGNILPLVLEYMHDTGNENRTSFGTFLKPLKDKKYIIIYPESEMGLSARSGGVYVHDNIQVTMTYEGQDYLDELRSKKAPPTQPISQLVIDHLIDHSKPPNMSLTEETEHGILNSFRVSSWQSEENLYIDLKRSGVGFRPTWDFDELLKRGYFDETIEDGIRKFKLNTDGLARFNKIDNKWAMAKGAASVIVHHNKGNINTGNVGGNQTYSTAPVNTEIKLLWKSILKWWTEHFFMRIIVGIITAVILYYIGKFIWHTIK